MMDQQIVNKIKERNAKFYTAEGISALNKRLENWIDLFNNRTTPLKAMSLGFGGFAIGNELELFYRIKELCEITGNKVVSHKMIEKNKDGTQTKIEYLELIKYG